jgi:iron complex outermembrane receptor protein
MMGSVIMVAPVCSAICVGTFSGNCGSRYGDVEHKKRVDAYTVADLRLTYTLHKLPLARSLKLALYLNNLFDKEYISVVNVSDDTRAGSASYYAGALFTALLTASLEF